MNAIPKAIAYTRNVNVIENHSFQAWLKEKVDQEDLIWWAQQPEERHLRDDIMEYYRTPLYRRLLGELNGALP